MRLILTRKSKRPALKQALSHRYLMIQPQAFLAKDKGVCFHNSQCRFFQSTEIEIFVLVFHLFIFARKDNPEN